jgi:hypothetical protein
MSQFPPARIDLAGYWIWLELGPPRGAGSLSVLWRAYPFQDVRGYLATDVGEGLLRAV